MGAQKRPASLAKRLFIKTEPWGCHGSERWYYTYIRTCVRYSHSMASVLPSRHSSCTQFSVPSRAKCRQVTPCRVSSASGTKVGTTSKTFFKLRALSFFVPKRAAGRLWKLDSAGNARLKLNRPLARKPPAAIASESTQVACRRFAKPQVADTHYR